MIEDILLYPLSFIGVVNSMKDVSFPLWHVFVMPPAATLAANIQVKTDALFSADNLRRSAHRCWRQNRLTPFGDKNAVVNPLPQRRFDGRLVTMNLRMMYPCLIGCAALAMVRACEAAPSLGGVPASRLSRLARGVNVTRWFRFPLADNQGHYQDYLGNEDMKLIRALGCTFVRLAIAPKQIIHPDKPREPNPLMLKYIDAAVDKFLAYDIAVVIDIHEEHFLKLDSPEGKPEDFVAFWSILAKHFKKYDPENIFFELMNEPVFQADPEKWYAIQKKLVTAVRAHAPDHSIIVTGAGWGSIDGLLKLPVLADKNLLYSFHCYDPFQFTHQGAGWTSPDEQALHNVPYPSSPEAVAPILPTIERSTAKKYLQSYGDQRWDALKLQKRIDSAAVWASKNGVPLMCGEFGVYPKFAPAADRLQWFRDMRKALDKHGIGFCIWGYDDVLGLGVKHDGGKIVYDKAAAEAVGLHTSRQ